MTLPSMHLAGKTALVTGAGSGIGKAIAVAVAEAGADCAVCELPDRVDLLDPVCREIEALGRRSVPIPLQLPDIESIDAAVTAAVEGLGPVDVLVNNAGVNIPVEALEVTEADWDAVLDVNLKGLFFMSQRVGREMKGSGGGKVVNIASQNGLVAYYDRAAYCASKAGVVNLTRSLALEWAPLQINVNAVGPTYVLTELTRATLEDPRYKDDIVSRIPLGRVAQPEDVVGAVVFLASPAADMITGHTLLVDGGWTAV